MFLNYCKTRWESFTSIKSTLLVGLLFLGTYQFVGAQITNDAPPPPPLDVELTISTPAVAVGQWKKIPVTITIKNSGYNVSARNIIVRVGTCFGNPATVTFDTKKGGIVYANPTASLITTGTFNLFNGTWSIPELVGESDARLKIDYFTLTDEPIKLFAFVEQMEGDDIDSSPMPYSTDLTCEVTEDDEALLVLNPTVPLFSCEGALTLTTQAEVDAFDCTSFDGALTIIGDGITNLDGLSSLKDNHKGVIYIQKTSVENLNGLANLESSNGLLIIANPNLQQVNLPKLTSLHSLAVIQNAKLTDLKGLASIHTLTGTLTISDNERLVSLEGLDNLMEVRNRIGLDKKIQIIDNPILSDCCVLNKVLNSTQSAGAINIEKNAFTCSSVEAIKDACSCTGDLILETQAAVDAFAGCTTYTGSISIKGGAITNIDKLSSLETIKGDLFIGSTGIKTLRPLSNLSTLTGRLTIGANNQLRAIDGLEKLTSTGGLAIAENQLLTDLGNLENLVKITTGGMTIFESDALTTINLPNLTFIGGDVFISKLSSITDLSSFSKLHSITGQLTIVNNANLVAIKGFRGLFTLNVNKNFGGLVIQDHPKLTDCCSVLHLLSLPNVQGKTDIQRNGLPCSSIEAIESTCQEATDLELTITALNRFPKKYTTFPVELTIKNNSTVKATDIKIDAFSICDNGSSLPKGILVQAGGSINTTKGRYSSGTWSISELAAGEEAILKVSYFVLKEQPFALQAEIVIATPKEDVDSTPSIFSFDTASDCIASEDDEAILAFNIPQSTCDCTQIDPLPGFVGVCGSDGKMYSTGCEAACAGVTWTDGPCTTTGITCGEITVTPLIDGMKIEGQAGENYFIKVHRTFPTWEYVYQCSFDCGSEIIIENLATGTYFVDVYNKSWKLICNDIEVSLIAIDGGFQTTTTANHSRNSLLNTSNLTNKKLLTIYPNPANKLVTFEVDAATYPTAQLYLSNNLGQVVKTIPLAQFDNNPISLDQFQSGFYQVSIVADGQIVAKEKLVVLR